MSKRKTTEPNRPYTITNVGGQKVEILIYDQIGSDFWSEGISAKQFVHDLQSHGKVRHIDVRINSPGGSFFDGLAIYNALKTHKSVVDVYVDGIAFSMASVIAMAGDTISMAKNALMMVHNPKGAVAGTPEEIRAYAELMEKARDSIVMAYEDKTGLPRDEILAMVTAETYMDAEDAVAKGFADEVIEQLAVAAHCQIPDFLNVPANVQAKLQSLSMETAMADPTQEVVAGTPERIPATIEQLKAMPGVDAEFIVDQLSVQATFEDAQQALNSRLLDRLTAAIGEISSLKAKLAETPPTRPAPPAPSPLEPVDIGTQPLISGSAGSDPTRTDNEWGDDPARFHRQLMRKLTSEGLSATAAMQRIADDYPLLIDSMIG